MSTIFGPDILGKKQKQGIRAYQYRGGDLSLTYKYILSPMAQYLVDHCTPTSLSPNMITLIGFSFNVFATIMTLIYDPELNNAPSWLPALTGCCLFTYQTLDNMDGKQARKLGASSPLGLMFDHGCDAICAGMCAIPLSSVFGCGWNATGLFTCWISGFLAFYTQTWEEYYLHEMWLPIVNGCSEGLVIMFVACMLSCYNGTNWWQKSSSVTIHSSIAPLFPFQIIIGQVLLIIIPCIIPQVYKVLKALYNDSAKGLTPVKRIANIRRAVIGLILCFNFLISTFSWCFISKAALGEGKYMLSIYMIVTFFEMATHLMLSHTTSSDASNGIGRFPAWLAIVLPLNSFYDNYQNVYNKFRTYLNVTHVIDYLTKNNQNAPSGTDLNFELKPIVDEYLVIQVLAIVSFIYTAIKMYRTIVSIADALDVYVFFLGKPSEALVKGKTKSVKKIKGIASDKNPPVKEVTPKKPIERNTRSRSRSKLTKT